ncbi:hypothetical protein U1Q18_038451 [Sarracenia purpurea var. burkii]
MHLGLLSREDNGRLAPKWESMRMKTFTKSFAALVLSLIIWHCIPAGNWAAEAVTIYVRNNCLFPVWPATASNKGQPVIAGGGFYLPPAQSKAIQAPGDCDGQLECNGKVGLPPATLVEITLQVDKSKPSFYDVSLVDGYNLPVFVSTKAPSTKCRVGGCVKDLKSECPEELQAVNSGGKVVACKSACLAFDRDEFCCRNEFGNPEKCRPSVYSKIFKAACPSYFSYAFDAPSPLVNCPSDEYVITFCPSKWGAGDQAQHSHM